MLEQSPPSSIFKQEKKISVYIRDFFWYYLTQALLKISGGLVKHF